MGKSAGRSVLLSAARRLAVMSDSMLHKAVVNVATNEMKAAVEENGVDESLEPPVVRPRVLVLDDSMITREAIADLLADAGYPVETAGDVLEFELKIKEFDPQVVLSDIQMPEIEGDQICRALKQRMDTERVPIILFSSLSDEELEVRAEASGADGFVSKQHGPERLLEVLDELLSQVIF